MNGVSEVLVDKLVGSSSYHKSEERIKQKDYLRVQNDFSKIKSFWGKACFLVFLKLHKKNKSVSAIGDKMIRKLKSSETAVYTRHIAPFVKEVNRLVFVDSTGDKIKDKLVERLVEHGEDEFIVLCRVVYSAGYSSWIDGIRNISLSQHKLSELKDVYQ